MLSVKLLPSNSEILKLQYIEEQDFSKVLVICPSPAKADGVRQYIQENGINAEVLTISKFIKDCMQTLGESAPNVSRKSELLLKLSTIWKIKNPELGYDIFTKAFNLYTELRGFTLNLELLEEILGEEDPKLATGIRFFWLVSEELGLVDEHQAYYLLSEEVRTNESPTHDFIDGKSLCFLGFKHLSGGQLDLLKSLGIRTEVTVPLHEQIYSNAESTSWIGWLEVQESKSFRDSKESELTVHRYKKGRFSEETSEVLGKLMSNKSEIYLSSAASDFSSLNVLPVEDVFFKTNADPFRPILISLIDEFKTLTDFGEKVLNEDKINEVIQLVENKAQKKDYFFRWLKVKSLFLRLCDEWKELSDINKELTYFDVEVFFEILDLDLPRNYLIPLFENEPDRFINSLDGAELNSSENTVVIGGAFLGPLKAGESNFSEKQLENLTTLGPIRSSELDFQTRKIALADLAQSSNLELILEDNIEESDISWMEMLEGFSLKNNSLSGNPVIKNNLMKVMDNLFVDTSEKQSATSLQTFLDCPRKYYYKYIDKLSLNPVIEESLRPFQLGIVEHEVIGKYFDREDTDLKELSVSVLNKVLAKDGIKLNPVQYQEALFEVILLSGRGIEFVKSIRETFGKGSLEFEKNFSDKVGVTTHRGSIDFYYESSDGCVIVDFKRSQGGIPQVGEFKEFEKIQTWYYLSHLNKEKENLKVFGYLNLKDPSSSLLYSPDASLVKELKSNLGPLGVKISHLKDFEELFSLYGEREASLMEKLVEEKAFLPNPLNSKVCSFCPAEYLCDRGKL